MIVNAACYSLQTDFILYNADALCGYFDQNQLFLLVSKHNTMLVECLQTRNGFFWSQGIDVFFFYV